MASSIRDPSVPITELERDAFCTQDQQASKPLSEELHVNVRWQRIPSEYHRLDPEELNRRISEIRERLGKKLLILGHHYQREEVIQMVDFRGDSFKLAQCAASHQESDFIVFCGVHFMAETADILSNSNQQVILPNLTAGCSMSDMAPTEDVLDSWDDLKNVLAKPQDILPITYMNSTAAIKALCGRKSGIVCTSSNAQAALTWAFDKAERVFFLPDHNLGRNSGLKLGLNLDEMLVWDPFKPLGGHTANELSQAKLILWKGHCSVHTRFTVEQIQQARSRYPDINVIVHPECTMEVVQSADMDGSTEVIIETINKSPRGSKWAVGTEINLVKRLAMENPDKTVFCLDSIVCPCSTMYRIHPAYLAWVLDSLVHGQVVNRIVVDPETSSQARVALERMLNLT